MTFFVLRRIGSGLALILVVVTGTFLLISLDPDAAVRNVLGEFATSEQIQRKAAELGLNEPLYVQYGQWIGNALRGDLGHSWITNAPVASALLQRMPVSLSLVLVSTVVTAVFSIVLGLTAAIRGGASDKAVQVLAVFGFAMPNFWFALVLVSLFSITIRLFPATGFVPFTTSPTQWASSLVLPVFALAVGTIASTAQQVRAATIDVLRQDYVRTLRSRGLPSGSIVFKHVLRNAATPALTVLSLQFVGLLAGSVVIERVFAIPGVGSLVVDAALAGDAPQVLGVVSFMVFMVVSVNFIIDLLTGWLNPKVRSQ
ncbi:ABC transporter permease [Paenarthrobacter sp. NyZ202]|uniref:ABC transporter permease n=1 Tax=Paenarthrobacter sp. NyZ202 TaxID=3402689 RepID=UPI003CFAA892